MTRQSDFDQVISGAQNLINQAVIEASAGNVKWQVLESPAGMTAYQGGTRTLRLLVTRARMVEHNGEVRFYGTVVGGEGPTVLMLPSAAAENLFKKAEASLLATN